MRKIISVLVVVILLLPLFASAQVKECCTLYRTLTIDGVTCNQGQVAAADAGAATGCTGAFCATSAPNWGMFCIMSSIYRITDWISYLLFAIVGVMIIIGAFTIVTAGGSPEKVTAGRNYILYAVMGLVVAFFARAIPALAKAIVGM